VVVNTFGDPDDAGAMSDYLRVTTEQRNLQEVHYAPMVSKKDRIALNGFHCFTRCGGLNHDLSATSRPSSPRLLSIFAIRGRFTGLQLVLLDLVQPAFINSIELARAGGNINLRADRRWEFEALRRSLPEALSIGTLVGAAGALVSPTNKSAAESTKRRIARSHRPRYINAGPRA